MAGIYEPGTRCWMVEMGDLAVDHGVDVAAEFESQRRPIPAAKWSAYVEGLEDGEGLYRDAGLGLLSRRMRRLLELVRQSDGWVRVAWFEGLRKGRPGGGSCTSARGGRS